MPSEPSTGSASGLDLIHLREQLAEHFNLDELQTLCADLGVQYENLSGDTLNAKTRELVKFCYRRDLMPKLISQCQKLRPDVQWVRLQDINDIASLPETWDDPMQQVYALVKSFNRNRHQPLSDERTLLGDEIAFQMREAAPLLFGKFDVAQWLRSDSAGKRLMAIQYLDWLQDIDYLDDLANKLMTERPFIQLHTLVTIHGMADQLDEGARAKLKVRLLAYNIVRADPSLAFWKQRLMDALS